MTFSGNRQGAKGTPYVFNRNISADIIDSLVFAGVFNRVWYSESYSYDRYDKLK